jgi:hypothetical protein
MWGWGRHFSRAGETVAPSTDTRRTRCSGDPGFSVHQVATGSLNDVRQCSPATVIPLSPPPPRHLHQVQTDASVTIRPLVLTPAQRVSHTSAETDVLQLKPAFMRQQVFRRETGGLSMWGVGISPGWVKR